MFRPEMIVQFLPVGGLIVPMLPRTKRGAVQLCSEDSVRPADVCKAGRFHLHGKINDQSTAAPVFPFDPTSCEQFFS